MEAGTGGKEEEGEESVEAQLQQAYSDILCEFLEVAIHLILYVRGLYPQAFFQRRRKYNVPVHMCIHPELNHYIRNLLDGVKPLLREGQVESIAVLIRDKDNQPTEKFVFKTSIGEISTLSEDSYLLELEAGLRALLLKISVCDAILRPNPPDCTFIVLVYTNQSAVVSAEHELQSKDFPWVTCDPDQDSFPPGRQTIPLKSVSSSSFKMQLHVEQAMRTAKTTT